MSLPSTWTPGKPYATAFCAIVVEAVWILRGVEIAHWLFWLKKIAGSFITPAKFIASWTAPSDVAPSPKKQIATVSSPFSLFDHASPAAWQAWLPTGIEI